MSKLELRPPVSTYVPETRPDIPTQWPGSERMPCLILLVPPDSDCGAYTRRICDLAIETNSFIRLLGLYKDTSEELSLRRELATMAALIRTAKICVEVVVEKGASWLEAVRHTYQSGDIIVCTTDLTMGVRQRPLSQILESNLNTPVCILSKSQPRSGPNVLAQAAVWLGLIAILAGFFFLQVMIIQTSNGGFQTLLFILLLIPEFWLLKVWNSLFP